jgi:hypothetical protein
MQESEYLRLFYYGFYRLLKRKGVSANCFSNGILGGVKSGDSTAEGASQEILFNQNRTLFGQ